MHSGLKSFNLTKNVNVIKAFQNNLGKLRPINLKIVTLDNTIMIEYFYKKELIGVDYYGFDEIDFFNILESIIRQYNDKVKWLKDGSKNIITY